MQLSAGLTHIRLCSWHCTPHIHDDAHLDQQCTRVHSIITTNCRIFYESPEHHSSGGAFCNAFACAHVCTHADWSIFTSIELQTAAHLASVVTHRATFSLFAEIKPKIPLCTRVHKGIYAQDAGQRALIGQNLGEPRSYWMG